jgi:hypothetical protein
MNLLGIEAFLAAGQGHVDEARRKLTELERDRGLHTVTMTKMAIAAAYTGIGDHESALRWTDKPQVRQMMHTLARLVPELHPLLDRPPFVPRRRDAALVWPLEAPMIDAARHALFKEVRIESGIPQGSELGGVAG